MISKTAACLLCMFIITTTAQAQFHLDPAINASYRFDFSPLNYLGSFCQLALNPNPRPSVSVFAADIAPQSTYQVELFSLATGLPTTTFTASAAEFDFFSAEPGFRQDWVDHGLGVQVTMLAGSMDLKQLTAQAYFIGGEPGVGPCPAEYAWYAAYRTTANVVPEPSPVVLAGLGLA